MFDMRRTFAFLVATVIAVATVPVSLDAQQQRGPRPTGTIDGVVSDTGLAPLQGAFVSILGTKIRIGTGPNGRFRITSVPTGQYLVIVKRVGFRPTSAVVNLSAADTLRLSYTLEPV